MRPCSSDMRCMPCCGRHLCQLLAYLEVLVNVSCCCHLCQCRQHGRLLRVTTRTSLGTGCMTSSAADQAKYRLGDLYGTFNGEKGFNEPRQRSSSLQCELKIE